LARPEPGPVGVSVDPLGEALGASVLPEGFVGLLLTTGGRVFALPVPFVDEPVVVPLTEPLTDEPLPMPVFPPGEPLLVCASASVLESASAPANAIVMSFMVISLVVDDRDK
jgi:hypothetical protein